MQVITLLPCLVLLCASLGRSALTKAAINISQAEIAPFSAPEKTTTPATSSAVAKNGTNENFGKYNNEDLSRIVKYSISTPKKEEAHDDTDDEIDALIRDAIRTALDLHVDAASVEDAVGRVQACAGRELLSDLASCTFEDLQASAADRTHKVGSVIDWCMFADQMERLGLCVRKERERVQRSAPRTRSSHPSPSKLPLSSQPNGTLQPLTMYEVMEERALVPDMLLLDESQRQQMFRKRTDLMKHPQYRVSSVSLSRLESKTDQDAAPPTPPQSDLAPHRLY